MHTQSILGLDPAQLDQLEARVRAMTGPWQAPRGRNRAMTLRQAVEICLFALRHNNSQQALAWVAKVSQPTISRIVARLRRVVLLALAPDQAGLADCQPGERLLLDGTLVPTGNRTGQEGKGLYSGKRHKAGVNLQVVSDNWGRLVHAGDPLAGATHDAAAFVESGLERLLAGHPTLGDKGYQGCGIHTPFKKPRGGKLRETQQVHNRAHASARAPVERAIALLKQWKVLGTGYRGPLSALPVVVRTVVALEKFRIYEKAF